MVAESPAIPDAINDCLSGIGLAIEQAFDKISVVFGAQAVGAGGGESAAGITHHARTKLQQVFIVAAVQRQVVDFLVAQRASQSGGGGVEQRNFFGDGHDFGNVAGLQSEIGANVGRDLDRNAGPLHRFEALRFDVNLVGSRGQVGGHVVSRSVSGESSRSAALHVGDNHVCSRNGGAALVGDRAQHASGGGLGQRGQTQSDSGREQEEQSG